MYDKMHIVSVTLRYTVCRNHNQLAPPTHKRRRHVRHHRLLAARVSTRAERFSLSICPFGQLPLPGKTNTNRTTIARICPRGARY
jgi:hypothetical protein